MAYSTYLELCVVEILPDCITIGHTKQHTGCGGSTQVQQACLKAGG